MSAASTEVLAKSIAAAVERQLTQQAEVLTKKFDARLAEQQQAVDTYQKALQTALEERLADFAQHQQLSVNEINNRIIESAGASAMRVLIRGALGTRSC